MRRIRTLYASSDADSIDVFTQRLGAYGYDVLSCTRGETAVKMVEQRGFDVAILSINLIGLNGFEICRLIRERLDDAELPIVIHASRDSHQWRLTAFDSGANIFAFDPILFDRLDDTVRNLLKFKFALERCLPLHEAVDLLDAAYTNPGARPAAGEAVWPVGADYRVVERYCDLLARNYLEDHSGNRDNLRSTFRLLLHMAEHLGSMEAAVSHLRLVARGTRLARVTDALARRSELTCPIEEEDPQTREHIEALSALIGLARCLFCDGMDARAAVARLRASAFRYDARLLDALASIVGVDEFMDSIFAGPTGE